MKAFINTKTAYSKGVSGVNNVFVNLIVINGEDVLYYNYEGMYGHDERVARALKEKGFAEIYNYGVYGQAKKKDVYVVVLTEAEMLEIIAKL